MTIQEHIELLQDIHRGIEGVKDAPDRQPSKAPDRTPAVLVTPVSGIMALEAAGQGDMDTARVYRVTIFGEPAGLNTFGRKAEEVYDVVEKILTEYHRIATNGFAGVTGSWPQLAIDTVSPLNESGLAVLTFSEGNRYTGYELRVTIRDQRIHPDA